MTQPLQFPMAWNSHENIAVLRNLNFKQLVRRLACLTHRLSFFIVILVLKFAIFDFSGHYILNFFL